MNDQEFEFFYLKPEDVAQNQRSADVMRESVKAMHARIDQLESGWMVAFEQGRQQGMEQERALWQLAKDGQEIEATDPASDVNVREKFERWAESQNWTLDKFKDGSYVYPAARNGWKAWQAASEEATFEPFSASLDSGAAALLRDTIGSEDASPITLCFCVSEEGAGLHVYLTEYPEEGVILLEEMSVGSEVGQQGRMPAAEAAGSDEADARRYRWLRSRVPGGAYRIMGVIYSEGGSGVDAAIDAAILKDAQEERSS